MTIRQKPQKLETNRRHLSETNNWYEWTNRIVFRFPELSCCVVLLSVRAFPESCSRNKARIFTVNKRFLLGQTSRFVPYWRLCHTERVALMQLCCTWQILVLWPHLAQRTDTTQMPCGPFWEMQKETGRGRDFGVAFWTESSLPELCSAIYLLHHQSTYIVLHPKHRFYDSDVPSLHHTTILPCAGFWALFTQG